MKNQNHVFRRLFFLLFIELIIPNLFAQHTDDKVYDKVDLMPQFPGGMTELMKYLRFPLTARDLMGCGVQGRVQIQFIIEKDGTVTHSKVIRSVDPLLDRYAMKLFNQMPRWIPGEQGGHKVRVKKCLFVRGELKDFIEQDKEKDVAFIRQQKALVIIDGVEVSTNLFNALSLNSIKSCIIVKGEEAVEHYGERGQNGVALIILKSAEEVTADSTTIAEEVTTMLRNDDFDKKKRFVYWLADKQLSPDDAKDLVKSKAAKYYIEIKREEIINVILKPFSSAE